MNVTGGAALPAPAAAQGAHTSAAGLRRPAPAAGLRRPAVRNPDPARPRPRPGFESAVPAPKENLATRLLHDSFLKETLQQPQESLDFFDSEVQRRKAMESAGQPYRFAPLITCLHNMQRLTRHILADRQFSQPLSAEDRAGFRVLEDRIGQLLALQAPYKATVRLALMMSCMQEIVTARHLMPTLCARFPSFPVRLRETGLFDSHSFCTAAKEGKEPERTRAEDASLAMVLSCSWGGLNPGRQDEKSQLFAGHRSPVVLEQLLDDHSLFLHPSFETLTPGDFCRFGHMAVYPLGMMTACAVNADGTMMSPLRFFLHDLNHASTTHASLHSDSDRPLGNACRRLQFRQRVLDRLPAALARYRLDRALELLLFNLLHENSVASAQEKLQADSFLLLLRLLSRVRREYVSHYPSQWQQVTDLQAGLAALWVYRTYHHWRATSRAQDQQDRLSERFVSEDLPALHQHLAFLERHHPLLQDHFLSRSQVSVYSDGSRWATFSGHSTCDPPHPAARNLLLLCDCHNESGEPVDNTDIVYFAALHSRNDCRQIEKLTGQSLPPLRF